MDQMPKTLNSNWIKQRADFIEIHLPQIGGPCFTE